MNKINNEKTKLKDLNKLILFNFVQTINSIFFWIFFGLSLISQPIILFVLHFLENSNILSYSLFIILIPLILASIFILIQINVLFQDNKTNSIEYKIICSKYSKRKIIFSKIISILIMLMPIIIIQDLSLLFLLGANIQKLLIALFVSNTFISLFIYCFIISFLALIALKISKTKFTVLSLFLGIITLGLSLVSRPFVISKTNEITYNNSSQYSENINFVRLSNGTESNLLLANKKNGSSSNITIKYLMNNFNYSNLLNNFIPSEWLISFYSTLFTSLKFDLNYTNNPYNILSLKIINQSIDESSNLLNFYAIRPYDIDFSLLNNDEYEELIFNNIKTIIEKYNLENDYILTQSIYSNITSVPNWNEISSKLLQSKQETINLLLDVTGVNTNFNQLFYLIKYDNLLKERIPNLFVKLANSYNRQISNIFEFILSSSVTKSNLFYNSDNSNNNGVLNTNQEISYYYPMIDYKVLSDKPSPLDIEFFKNKLFKFIEINNTINLVYLINPTTYSLDTSSIDSTSQTITNINKLNKILPSVTNYETWSKYLDSIKTYNDLQSLLVSLTNEFQDIYQYSLNNNALNIIDSIGLFNSIYVNNNSFPLIFIALYSFLFLLLIYLLYKKQSHHDKSEKESIYEKNNKEFTN